jgi:hypothetical protein
VGVERIAIHDTDSCTVRYRCTLLTPTTVILSPPMQLWIHAFSLLVLNRIGEEYKRFMRGVGF